MQYKMKFNFLINPKRLPNANEGIERVSGIQWYTYSGKRALFQLETCRIKYYYLVV